MILSAAVLFCSAILAMLCFCIQVISKVFVGVTRALFSSLRESIKAIFAAVIMVALAFVFYWITYFLSSPGKALANTGAVILTIAALVIVVVIAVAFYKTCFGWLFEMSWELLLMGITVILSILGWIGRKIYEISQKGYVFFLGVMQKQVEKSVPSESIQS